MSTMMGPLNDQYCYTIMDSISILSDGYNVAIILTRMIGTFNCLNNVNRVSGFLTDLNYAIEFIF